MKARKNKQIIENKAVSDFFEQWKIDPDQGILIAVSGGIDSTALMGLLARYRDSRRQSFNLHGLYVNHNIRSMEEIEHDWKSLTRAAEICAVPLHRVDLPEGSITRSAATRHEGIESAARRARYKALEEWRNRLRFGYIALGHTLDDLVETMLMRFLQGSGVSGLHGIPPVMGSRIRPLLEISKEELKRIVQDFGLPFSEDSSNMEDWYLRNRIRRTIMPLLLEEFPSMAESLKKSARFFREEEALLQDEAYRRIHWNLGEHEAEIEIDLFFSAPDALRIRSLLALVNHYIPGKSRVPRDFLSLQDTSPARKDAVLLQGHGFTVKRQNDQLIFIPSVVFKAKTRYVKRIFWGIDGGIGELAYTWNSSCSGPNPGGAIALPLRCRERELYLRSRRLSDSIRTSGGTKRLKDLFREFGITEEFRDRIPVLQAGDEVAAVFGSVFGYRDMLAKGYRAENEQQKAVLLRIRRMEMRIGR
ncbi:tRNA lysidine(34) synthetase TilS [Marispirochaeta sp.]|uniref:tRNA lysidine(34) synthetase TilS n=1 Tax=Marispirochaeta sp. TaxID=2038653 RepID=UPI0029C73D3E|nr:tRNA lysidine(34) synthetase TilS [Marispirochaeta sp.]